MEWNLFSLKGIDRHMQTPISLLGNEPKKGQDIPTTMHSSEKTVKISMPRNAFS